MGLLRVWLAMAVLSQHIGQRLGFRLLDSGLAVEAFFVVSGFYMSFILSAKYSGKTGLFYLNRALRIYPSYWLLLILTLVFFVALGWRWRLLSGPALAWAQIGPQLNGWSLALMLLGHLFILPQSFLFFVAFKGGWPYFSWLPYQQLRTAYSLLLIPPAWSLGAEEIFYLAAPWILRLKKDWFIGLLAASLGLKLLVNQGLGLNYDPWSYMFFPAEFFFFVLGVACHRFYAHAKQLGLLQSGALRLSSLLLVVAIIALPSLGISRPWDWALLSALLFLGLPHLFELSLGLPGDRRLGTLSYPLYLCHTLVITLLRSPFLPCESKPWFGPSVALLSLGLAWCITVLVERPIDRIRQKLAAS